MMAEHTLQDDLVDAAMQRLPRHEPTWLRLLWSICNLPQLAFTLLWTAGLIPIALALRIAAGSGMPLRMASRVWAPGLLYGAGVRFTVEGADNIDWSKPYLLVANHQSVIDICALFRAVPVPLRFLLKREMTRVPLVGRYAKATGMLFIDRDNRRAGPRMLRDAATMLREGNTLCVFPEGTRSRDGRVAVFKGGPFQAAIDAGVEVLPVAITGAGAVLPPTGLFRVRPGRIAVRFGTPQSAVGAQRQALAHGAHAAVLALLVDPPVQG
jgi:1-acyl-sn-glycerol-3-phosphate acyltransferase